MTLAPRRAGCLAAALLLAGGCGISDPTPNPVAQEEPPPQQSKYGQPGLPPGGQPGALPGSGAGLAAAGYRSSPLPPRQPVPEGWTMEQTALDSLVRIGQPAVPALVKLLDRPEAKIRGEAVAALARIGPEARPAVPRLVALVENDPDPTVRKFAVRALGQIGPAAAPAVGVLVEQLRADAGRPPAERPAANPPAGRPLDDDEPANVR